MNTPNSKYIPSNLISMRLIKPQNELMVGHTQACSLLDKLLLSRILTHKVALTSTDSSEIGTPLPTIHTTVHGYHSHVIN